MRTCPRSLSKSGRRGGPRPAGSSLGSELSPAHLAKAGLDRPEWGPGGRAAGLGAPALGVRGAFPPAQAEGPRSPRRRVHRGRSSREAQPRDSRLAFRAPSRPASPGASRPFSVPWGRGRAAALGSGGSGAGGGGGAPQAGSLSAGRRGEGHALLSRAVPSAVKGAVLRGALPVTPSDHHPFTSPALPRTACSPFLPDDFVPASGSCAPRAGNE